jgi:hypothetical protein
LKRKLCICAFTGTIYHEKWPREEEEREDDVMIIYDIR